MLKKLLLALSLLLPLAVAAEKAENAETAANPVVVIETTEGNIVVELFAQEAPLTVANFLAYVESGHYADTIFHRVISNFMIQGGGFTEDFTQKATQDPVKNESRNRLHNTRGTIAMARTNDPDSATSQFFINQRSNLQLDWAPGRQGYTVFGEVLEGMDVVDFIATAPTGKRGRFSDVPVDTITIKSITVKPVTAK